MFWTNVLLSIIAVLLGFIAYAVNDLGIIRGYLYEIKNRSH